ncbi:GatB/YqeY domain-containing protein [Azovibrio restrictus]|uniref:GatB/YqeY domain-containing protein n=1 Tax=Azovibrio restrictus TaxID=146938 RepID=UPI000400B404|nr:GatB/YqeY domain-containing protein [Azovibrio restrictus]
MSLKARITEDMKTAMKAKETVRLGAIRLLLAAIKQKEVDEQIELDETGIVAVIEKMTKQRKDSLSQYEAAGRTDLAEVERAEITVLAAYLPEKMGEAEINAAIDAAAAATGAASAADMGKLMGVLKPQLAGKADMALVSKLVKAKLG